MSWTVLLCIVMGSLLKIVITSLPSGVVEWMTDKFQIHSKLNQENSIVTMANQRLEGEEKAKIIRYFNDASFKERHYIWPGTEQSYLHPTDSGTLIIVDTKSSKKDVRLFIYCYNDRVEVIKQYKKKMLAYRLFPGNLVRYAQRLATDIFGSENPHVCASGE
ncbi:hypothetical protein GFC29_65 [Anoxybacillus sp. B7M1]|uniref:YfmQ family protein n=1 Tax=unclassified Anoxybacillus TaxID=2639704 RepID=UPI0005CD127B|nr:MULTISPECIES: YfmQ family protein [unclassified Anoxybacillus]ANB56488.1 hypothetical protein GFC28_1563 [Anoxybacillus sp. B2M1]ANB65443.1 hypothetical protein GFC29_65 [Anoxybacillus sp. B7M1]